ncbi:conserved hypothetical protein [Formosa agariphila KMM 3901]|uniref:Uncharacterized protein n=1 Tax=Formosa agariphila (strain DSM 15362 / KCTC 12365 / LMG 23005 / KMM 3901 / M-2Alg 35-1) TaxID=1347342 RepID=T2KNU6_FORAG|nr:hypothetical protein [Formosa agariphila]CDF80133.1 conserved hypothetical protein [Formosa agariphila KMM 3901]
MSKEPNDLSVPRGLITPEQAKALDQAYNPRHELISKTILKKPDNRSTWFALDELENYIAYAKKQASELGYTLDGVRIYEGAYPDDKEGAGYTTMFLIPTGTPNDLKSTVVKTKSLRDGGDSDGLDVPGGAGLNMGQGGSPPPANYPQ